MAGLLLLPGDLFRNLDWHVHLCWLQGFHDGLTQGAWYPRWVDGANEGQGGPVFLYYAPLVYYLGSIFMALGAHVATALKAVYLVSLLVCAGGLYVWFRPIVGTPRAIAFAAFGLLTPQLTLFAYSYNMPASALAVGVLPWVGWALERRSLPLRRIVVLAAVLATLLLSHTLTSFQTLSMLALASVAALFHRRTRGDALRVLPPATLLALVLAAVYVLPLSVSGDLVHAQHLIDAPQWRITANLQFGWLFGGAAARQGAFEFDIANGLALIALALAVWRIVQRGEVTARRGWLPFAAAAAFAFLLMTPLAVWLYEAVEPLRYLQFGWRWQALFLLCTLRVVAEALQPVPSMSAQDLPSASATAMSGVRSRPGFGIALTTCAVGLVVCLLRITPPFANDAAQDAAARRVGLAEAGRFAQRCAWPMLEYRPQQMGAAWRHDLAHLPRTPSVLSGRAHIVSADVGNETKRYTIVADLRSRVVFPVLDFPGWRVRVGAVEEPARALPDDGRIVVELERGRHEVELRFDPPAAARAGADVSLGGLVLWVALVWRSARMVRLGKAASK